MVNNKELIILIGISGSGKSTWTEEYIKNNNNTIRINRDDIRKSLVKNLNGYYQRIDFNQLESIVSGIIYNLFNALMKIEKDIILDNTNLKKQYFENFITEAVNNGYNIKFKFFEVSLDASKRRVLNRDYNTWCDDDALINDPEIVSKTDYINGQYEQYKQIKKYALEIYPHLIIYNNCF